MPTFPPSRFSQIPASRHPKNLFEVMDEYDRELHSGKMERLRPAPLGFPLLDQAFGGGVHMEDLLLIGGMQNVGKTILALQIARNMARGGEVVPVMVCYEHSPLNLFERLLCLESADDLDSDEPQGISLAELHGAIVSYYEQKQRSVPDLPSEINLDWIAARYPHMRRAIQRFAVYRDRLFLVGGDGVSTTVQSLATYVEMMEYLGHKRIALIVDYLQRIPAFSLTGGAHLSPEQMIDLVTRALKGICLTHKVPVIAVAAADADSLRQQRVHLENLWGSSVVQYEPDGALILNRDSLEDNQRKMTRVAIEKNRSGPSEIEFRHRLHGAHYGLSLRGTVVPPSESFQAERLALKTRQIAGPDPGVALMLMIALNMIEKITDPTVHAEKSGLWNNLWQRALLSSENGREILPELAESFSSES